MSRLEGLAHTQTKPKLDGHQIMNKDDLEVLDKIGNKTSRRYSSV
jgi:hypothetical protein